MDEQERRLKAILGRKNIDVTEETLSTYFEYLKANLKLSCEVKGSECFDWEEYYLFGPGKASEYEKKKKSQPSYEDILELLRLEEDFDEEYGIIVATVRLSDKKKFPIPLSYLECVDKKSSNSQIIDDYRSWFVNYQ